MGQPISYFNIAAPLFTLSYLGGINQWRNLILVSILYKSMKKTLIFVVFRSISTVYLYYWCAPAYRQLSCYYNIKELVNAGTHRIHFLYLPKINENRLKVDINFGVYLLIYCHFLLIGFRLKKMANKR